MKRFYAPRLNPVSLPYDPAFITAIHGTQVIGCDRPILMYKRLWHADTFYFTHLITFRLIGKGVTS